jgi:acyl-CoA thioester hydrolase
MASEYRSIHRVEFSDTDMAGIMHFASFFRFMEATEHAFFRSLGLSIHTVLPDRTVGWPRVHVSCDYKEPLRFEDEFEVQLRVREKRSKSLSYDFIFRKLGPEPPREVAHGVITAVCVAKDEQTGRMKAVPIPEAIAGRIEEAPRAGDLEEPGGV